MKMKKIQMYNLGNSQFQFVSFVIIIVVVVDDILYFIFNVNSV